jgi:putative glutamine amidotransferase
VHSHHVQALDDPGRLTVVGEAPDGVIEAVESNDRPFFLGVQWHPERSDDPRTGRAIFQSLLNACHDRASS